MALQVYWLNQLDHKMTLTITDHSIPYDRHGLKFHVFNAPHKMPSAAGVADAVIIRNAKVRSKPVDVGADN